MKVGILGNGQLGQMLQDSITDLTDVQVSLYDLRAHDDEALAAFIAKPTTANANTSRKTRLLRHRSAFRTSSTNIAIRA